MYASRQNDACRTGGALLTNIHKKCENKVVFNEFTFFCHILEFRVLQLESTATRKTSTQDCGWTHDLFVDESHLCLFNEFVVLLYRPDDVTFGWFLHITTQHHLVQYVISPVEIENKI